MSKNKIPLFDKCCLIFTMGLLLCGLVLSVMSVLPSGRLLLEQLFI